MQAFALLPGCTDYTFIYGYPGGVFHELMQRLSCCSSWRPGSARRPLPPATSRPKSSLRRPAVIGFTPWNDADRAHVTIMCIQDWKTLKKGFKKKLRMNRKKPQMKRWLVHRQNRS